MTGDQAVSVSSSSSASTAPPVRLEGWKWRRAAFLLAGAAQLITISALLSSDPLPASWAPLLLAIAPAPLTAAVAFTKPSTALPAAVAAVGVLVAGTADSIQHVGALFLPALVALVIGSVPLWRARS